MEPFPTFMTIALSIREGVVAFFACTELVVTLEMM